MVTTPVAPQAAIFPNFFYFKTEIINKQIYNAFTQMLINTSKLF